MACIIHLCAKRRRAARNSCPSALRDDVQWDSAFRTPSTRQWALAKCQRLRYPPCLALPKGAKRGRPESHSSSSTQRVASHQPRGTQPTNVRPAAPHAHPERGRAAARARRAQGLAQAQGRDARGAAARRARLTRRFDEPAERADRAEAAQSIRWKGPAADAVAADGRHRRDAGPRADLAAHDSDGGRASKKTVRGLTPRDGGLTGGAHF